MSYLNEMKIIALEDDVTRKDVVRIIDIAIAAESKVSELEKEKKLFSDNIKQVLIQAAQVVAWRAGDISTEDGSYATTCTDAIIKLEQALCEAFSTSSDDVVLEEILPLINALDSGTDSLQVLMNGYAIGSQNVSANVDPLGYASIDKQSFLRLKDWQQFEGYAKQYPHPFYLNSPVPKGYKIVPCEPTPEMIASAHTHDPLGVDVEDDDAPSVYGAIWFGMLAAASITNNSEPVQRITEQDAREIAGSVGSYYKEKTFRSPKLWWKDEGVSLIAKLNEHRGPIQEIEPVGSPDEVGGGKSRNNECRLIGNELSELAVLIFNGEAGSSQNILDELRKLVYKLWDLTSPTPDSVIAQRDELQAALNQVTANKAEVPIKAIHFCMSCAKDGGYQSNASTVEKWLDSLQPLKDE